MLKPYIGLSIAPVLGRVKLKKCIKIDLNWSINMSLKLVALF